jgi:hypothetical protein
LAFPSATTVARRERWELFSSATGAKAGFTVVNAFGDVNADTAEISNARHKDLMVVGQYSRELNHKVRCSFAFACSLVDHTTVQLCLWTDVRPGLVRLGIGLRISFTTLKVRGGIVPLV